jgi:probable F420-dependent oxidoreductase
MKIETNLREIGLHEIGGAGRLAEELGFDSLSQAEVKRDPFVSLTIAAGTTSRIRLATAVAIVFPRSPMVVAYMARNIHDYSGGRFSLGIGTQVKGHIQRRFSTEWDRPGPRLREYALALRSIWDAWQHTTPLDFEGEFYRFNLMTPEFDPGPSQYDPVPVYLAAVNRYLIRAAGEVGDGLRTHSFTTPEYLRDVIWPNVIRGARKAGRSLDRFEMVGSGFVAMGADEEAVARAREWVRHRIAWYASTRTYLPVLEHHGWQEINPRLRELIDARRWDALKTLVSDEMLDTFCTSGTYDTIVGAARSRVEGLTDTLSFPLPFDAEQHRDQLADAVARLGNLRGADAYRQQAQGPAASGD